MFQIRQPQTGSFQPPPHLIIGILVNLRLRERGRAGAAVGALCFYCVLALDAYEVPLTAASLHQGYVLGQRNDSVTAAFFAPYLKEITSEGAKGPHIAQVEVLTPFAQIVDDSRQHSSGYSEQESAKSYHQRGDAVVVRIVLMLPAAFPAPQSPQDAENPPADKNASLRPENFWQNFKFNVRQRGKLIPSRSIHHKPIYSAATKDTPSVLDGATVSLDFDARDVASEETTVEVVTPDAKTISATFDLKKLH